MVAAGIINIAFIAIGGLHTIAIAVTIGSIVTTAIAVVDIGSLPLPDLNLFFLIGPRC
jgi:hypothetical protein